MESIFDGFLWHSSIGIDEALDGNKRFVTRIANTPRARAMFASAGDNILIHKTTQALWKLTDDKSAIEPVFGSDVLTEDDLKAFDESQGTEE